MAIIEIKFVVPDHTRVSDIAAIARRSAAELDGYLIHTGTGFRIDVPARSRGKRRPPDMWGETKAKAGLTVYDGR